MVLFLLGLLGIVPCMWVGSAWMCIAHNAFDRARLRDYNKRNAAAPCAASAAAAAVAVSAASSGPCPGGPRMPSAPHTARGPADGGSGSGSDSDSGGAVLRVPRSPQPRAGSPGSPAPGGAGAPGAGGGRAAGGLGAQVERLARRRAEARAREWALGPEEMAGLRAELQRAAGPQAAPDLFSGAVPGAALVGWEEQQQQFALVLLQLALVLQQLHLK
eukprot:m51a1_g1722 hypothetical protein (217) ;mRNA; r:74399-102270